MILLVATLLALVAGLVAALLFVVAKTRSATERAARALADSMAREVKAAAEKKAQLAADEAIREVENATVDDLERRVRDLARRDRVP